MCVFDVSVCSFVCVDVCKRVPKLVLPKCTTTHWKSFIWLHLPQWFTATQERRNINAITISELKAAKAKRSWSCSTQEWKKDFDGNVFNEKFFGSAFFSTSASSRDRNFSAFSFRAKIIIADNWSNLNLQNSAGHKKIASRRSTSSSS